MINRKPKGSRDGGRFAASTDGKTNVPMPSVLSPSAVRLAEAKNAESLASNQHPLKFFLISEGEEICNSSHTEADHKPDGSHWVHDIYTTYLIEGDLATRIKNRMNVSASESVYYIEMQIDSSYSEYTQEKHFAFAIKVGDQVEDFGSKNGSGNSPHDKVNGLVSLLKWLQEGELGSEANAVAQALGSQESFKDKALTYFKGIRGF